MSSKSKHTPGPWYFADFPAHMTIMDGGGFTVFDMSVPGHGTPAGRDPLPDVRLVCKAPAMLDLLARLYNDRDDSAEMREVEALLRDLGVTP